MTIICGMNSSIIANTVFSFSLLQINEVKNILYFVGYIKENVIIIAISNQ